MKAIAQKVINLRNPNFKFDENLNSFALIQFIWIQIGSLTRGFKLLFYLKNPKGMLLGKNVSFFNTPKIKFGKFLKLGNHVYVSGLSKNGITFGNNVSIGHNAIVHGCTIHDNVLIGMGAIVMDNCIIESNSIIAAGAVITQNTVVPSGTIWAGVPAKKVKEIDQSDFAGEIERISNNYVMYSSWFKEEN